MYVQDPLKELIEKQNKTKKPKLWFDTECNSVRKYLRALFNKKNIEILVTLPSRQDYHTAHKAHKKLIKRKKTQLLNLQIDELVQNKDSHKFWDYLKTLKEGNQTSSHKLDIPSDKLYEHFKELHSAPNLSTSLTNHTRKK